MSINFDERVTIKEFSAVALYGVSVQATYADASVKCSALWADFHGIVGDSAFVDAQRSFGVSIMNDPSSASFEYWAALEFKNTAEVPAGLKPLQLQGGTYAVCEVHGLPELNAAFTGLYDGTWKPKDAAYKIDMLTPCFELYPCEYVTTGKFFIYAPLVKK